VRLAPHETIEVDGKLDDSVWLGASFTADFTQKDPREGAPASERTEVAFVYSDHALYVGARMHSEDPERIRAILARRDDPGDSERLNVSIDSYRNRRTAYAFGVSAAGGRLDWFTPEDAEFRNRDCSYDPVWAAKVSIDSTGWTAEMEIPFSQLRFNEEDSAVWGINVNRYIPSRNEDDYWIAVPKDESGWVSWFGDLAGLEGIHTRRPAELVPYLTTNAAVTSEELVDPDDPFGSRTEIVGRGGADLKLGIGPGLTLDATFNPDFGQVEADPAEVNLSAFPTFFEERRPFFVEGRELFESGGLFYSRRIGAPPHGEAEADFVERPGNTTILTAGKLTGRSASGLSIGALAAVTAEEHAATYDSATAASGEVTVEPATVWAAVSGRQELGAAASTVGFAATAVRRFFSGDSALATQMNREAYAATLDWNLRLEGGAYELRGRAGASYVRGTAGALRRIQEFSSHYFQRPDADHVRYDTIRTSLEGYTVGLALARTSAEHWLWEIGAGATTQAASGAPTGSRPKPRCATARTPPGCSTATSWQPRRRGSGTSGVSASRASSRCRPTSRSAISPASGSKAAFVLARRATISRAGGRPWEPARRGR
jgi:hypothetical protein